MSIITRWWRRRLELAPLTHRRRALESQLATVCGHDVALRPAASKGGYDTIFYARHAGRQFAVVRLNNPNRQQDDPIGEFDPGVPLGPGERLEREWAAYEKLGPVGLSPQTIWRGDDAIACTWLDWERVASCVNRSAAGFWDQLERIIPSISRMHELGVTHLDLNLGNILSDPSDKRIAFIDFEFGPRPWIARPQQGTVCGHRQLLTPAGGAISVHLRSGSDSFACSIVAFPTPRARPR